MIYLLIALAGLVLTYALTLASFAWEDLLMGTILAGVLMVIYRHFVQPSSLPSSGYVLHIVVNIPRLIWMVLVDIMKGTWQVVVIVLGLRPLEHPGMLKIPLANHGRIGVAIVSLIVTLSPGSFLVATDWEERMMLVHFIDTSNPDELRAHVERYYALWEYDSDTPTSEATERGNA